MRVTLTADSHFEILRSCLTFYVQLHKLAFEADKTCEGFLAVLLALEIAFENARFDHRLDVVRFENRVDKGVVATCHQRTDSYLRGGRAGLRCETNRRRFNILQLVRNLIWHSNFNIFLDTFHVLSLTGVARIASAVAL